ncbi:hypothetical protein SDC9_164075 [bioreactor metagenome]|uniref:Uncharacterized protein n=1 Tax=bioreactor metagenome TaxID=1076179 RepID=A0A645FS62_9ZZZZ|nr:hypothetical protein [Lachnospiraceae bacterium]
MEISEERLKELIIKAIRRVQLENAAKHISMERQKVYVILSGALDNQVRECFLTLEKQSKYEVCAVIPDNQDSQKLAADIYKANICTKVIVGNPADFFETDVFVTIFPIVSRDLIIRTALGFSDTYETRWIRAAMEKGQKILFLQNGLEKFTGKEPKAYIERILGYIRIILEFGIQIGNEFLETFFLPSTNNFIQTEKRKIITASDLGTYQKSGKIYLGIEDVITVMAKERAAELGIQIFKTY